MNDNYTQNAQSALVDAQDMAVSLSNTEVKPEHLHLALLNQKDGLIPKLLQYMEADPELLKADLNDAVNRLPKVSGDASQVFASRQLSQVLLAAGKEAELFKDEYVSVEHLYLENQLNFSSATA